MNKQNTNTKRWLIIFSLIFAGEMIFSLPFHIVRVFRPTMLEVFGVTNTEIGDSMAVYGIMAMIAYFPGGTLADRFPARNLMVVSLLATALGGLFLAQIPGPAGLTFVYGWWGVTTIFLFWASMIKATREWGGAYSQGKAFGLLDGGRGLIAAATATLAVILLSSIMPTDLGNADTETRREALQAVIYLYTAFTLSAAIFIWFFIRGKKQEESKKSSEFWAGLFSVFQKRVVWMQALIVVCAYSAYKSLEFFTMYAVDVLGMDEITAARYMSNALYLRAFGAILAGLIVDRFSASKVIGWLFAGLVATYLFLSIVEPSDSIYRIIIFDFAVTFLAVYGLRGVYFSLLEETKIAAGLTGTAVGLISVVGYTPDVFFNSLAGRLLDGSPGITGHHHLYLVLAGFSFAGLISVILLSTFAKNKPSSSA